jgi:hypothetical protein
MSDTTETARALLARLGEKLDADAPPHAVAAALAGAAERVTDRAARKEIRRVLYRLEQAGIAVPPPEPIAPAAPILGPSIEAWVSSVDGRGDRLVWLVREHASGGVLLIAADVNEPAGLRDLRTFDVTRKQLRDMRRRFQTDAGLTFVPVDWRRVDALVLEAQDRLAEPDRRLDYRRTRPRVTAAPPLAPAELVSTRVAPPGSDERAGLVATSTSLLGEPELRTWWPRPDDAAAIIAEVREVRESPIVLPPAQQEERLRAILERAASQLYPEPPLGRRLRATAFVLAETGRPGPAATALAVAAALEAGTPPGAIPLVQALVQRRLGTQLAAAEAERREERAGALVLTPGELATRKSPSRPPRSRG